jgi:ATP-dependent Clp protease protease subunit
MKKELNGIYRKHTGQTLEKLEADTDRDRFMSATEGLSYGLIDKILEHQPAITKNPDAI